MVFKMATAPEESKAAPPPPSGAIPASIEAAFQRTRGFPSSRAGAIEFPAEKAEGCAAEEAAFGRIDVDERGLTAGMRLNVLQPMRTILAEWREARAPFDEQLAPHIDQIESIDKLPHEIAALERKCESEESALERATETGTEYKQVQERYDIAEAKFKQKFAENGQRPATLWGRRPTYVMALAFTGIAEWFINYDVFLRFLQVPAWAFATAIILGLVLALSADGHGTLLKQWAVRFSPARTRAQRFGDWRLLALSSVGLLIVLAAAGGSRYAAVMRVVGNAPAITLLGSEADIDISPIRDVLISLLGNVGAWLVGVFFAYLGHDPDPDYMGAAYEREKARNIYNRRRAELDEEKKTVRARCAEEIVKRQNIAQSHRRDFERYRNLLLQVREHENVIVADIQAALTANIQRYHDALVQLASQRSGKLSFVRASDGQAVPPYEYKNTAIGIDADFVRSLA